MPALIKEDHLKAFLISLNLDENSLTGLDHETLLGFTTALLEYEGRAAQEPTGGNVYGLNGYITGLKTLAKGGADKDDPLGYATLGIRCTEQTIGRLLGLVGELEAASTDTPPLVKPIRSLLYATGLLFNMTNNRLEESQYKAAMKDIKDRMTDARKSIEDAKKVMRERGVNV